MRPKDIIITYADEIAAAIASGQSRTAALKKYAVDGVNLASLRVAYTREFPSDEKTKKNTGQFDLLSVLKSIQNRVDEKISEHVDPFEEIINSVEGKKLLIGLFDYVNEGKLKISEVREILNSEGVKVSPAQLKQVFIKFSTNSYSDDNEKEHATVSDDQNVIVNNATEQNKVHGADVVKSFVASEKPVTAETSDEADKTVPVTSNYERNTTSVTKPVTPEVSSDEA